MRNSNTRRRSRPKKVDDGLSSEERAAKREADAKRAAFLATINDSGKGLETRVKFASTVLCVPPPELRQLSYDSYEIELKDSREAALAIELFCQAQHCPQGNTDQRYDPNFGYRQVLWEVARRFEKGNLDFVDKLALPIQKSLSALVTEAMVSEDSVTDLIFDLVNMLEQDPAFALTRTSLGFLNGLEFVGEIPSEEGLEQLAILLMKLEAARELASNDLEETIVARSVAIVANIVMDGAGGEPPENPVAIKALSVLQAEEEARLEAARIQAEEQRRKAAEVPKAKIIVEPSDDEIHEIVEPTPAVRKAKINKPQAKALTPVEVVKLINVYNPAVSVDAVLDKISWEAFKKDAFVLNFAKKASEEDGIAIRCKLFNYVIEGFYSDSRSRFRKSNWLAKKLFDSYVDIRDTQNEHELIPAGKLELGRLQLETLAFMFDKKLGSLQERTERAEPFIKSIIATKVSIGAFFAGLNEVVKENVVYFRQPSVQTVMVELGEQKPLGLTSSDEEVVKELKQSIWEAFARVDDGSLKFPSDRSKDYFIECGEGLLALLAD